MTLVRVKATRSPVLSVAPDFGRAPEDLETAARSLTGQVYILCGEVVMRGPSAIRPVEAWAADARR
jgi:hypothetical protein